MVQQNTLTLIKSAAKRVAHARGVAHVEGLNLVAIDLGHPHWPALMSASERGWDLTPDQLFRIGQMVRDDETALALITLGPGLVFTRWEPADDATLEYEAIHGILDGEEFYIAGDEFEVCIGLQGWEITLDQAPSAKPERRRLGKPVKSVDALDPTLVERATTLLKIRARRMHAEVVADWPENSTHPDADGNVVHPLRGGFGKEWHCLHCDAVIAGPKLAANLWHCPECGATPIDIFSTPWWLGEKVSA